MRKKTREYIEYLESCKDVLEKENARLRRKNKSCRETAEIIRVAAVALAKEAE